MAVKVSNAPKGAFEAAFDHSTPFGKWKAVMRDIHNLGYEEAPRHFWEEIVRAEDKILADQTPSLSVVEHKLWVALGNTVHENDAPPVFAENPAPLVARGSGLDLNARLMVSAINTLRSMQCAA